VRRCATTCAKVRGDHRVLGEGDVGTVLNRRSTYGSSTFICGRQMRVSERIQIVLYGQHSAGQRPATAPDLLE